MLLQLREIRSRPGGAPAGRDALHPHRRSAAVPAGVFYLHQIEGLEVFTEEGENLGRVTEILKTGANDVYVVQGAKGEMLLPAIPQVSGKCGWRTGGWLFG